MAKRRDRSIHRPKTCGTCYHHSKELARFRMGRDRIKPDQLQAKSLLVHDLSLEAVGKI
jgi:hypothetical protein